MKYLFLLLLSGCAHTGSVLKGMGNGLSHPQYSQNTRCYKDRTTQDLICGDKTMHKDYATGDYVSY